MKNKMSQEQIDVLKEIVTIGAGNAATALSQMLKKKIDIIVPDVKITAIEKTSDIFGGAETLVSAVYLGLLGDVSGVILFLFSKEEAHKLTDILLDRQIGRTKILDKMDQSALKETATILSGAYLNALSKLLNMRLLVSSPAFVQDMAGAVVDNILIETSKEADHCLLINTELKVTEEKVGAYFFFIPDKKSLEKILKAI